MDLQRFNSISGLLPPAAEADALSDSLTQHLAESGDANLGQLAVPIVASQKVTLPFFFLKHTTYMLKSGASHESS